MEPPPLGSGQGWGPCPFTIPNLTWWQCQREVGPTLGHFMGERNVLQERGLRGPRLRDLAPWWDGAEPGDPRPAGRPHVEGAWASGLGGPQGPALHAQLCWALPEACWAAGC